MENTKSLVEFMMNRRPKDTDSMWHPLWRLYREKLMEELDRSFSSQMQAFKTAARSHLQKVNESIELLEKERDHLCVKYGLPFEDINYNPQTLRSSSW